MWKNTKHIFIIVIVTLFLLVSVLRFFGIGFFRPITYFFLYRESPLQNAIYHYTKWKPSDTISIIKIDSQSLDSLQAEGNLKMLRIPKSIYISLIEKLERVGVQAIGFDIVFENTDPDEEDFQKTLKKYPNIVIATASEGCAPVGLETTGALMLCEKTLPIPKDLTKYTPPYCHTDQSGNYMNCPGFPRSLYDDVTWGLIDMQRSADRRPSQLIIRENPYTSGSIRTVDTLPLALYRKVTQSSIHPPETLLHTFFGKPNSYPQISLIQVLRMSDEELEKNFGGKYILIGENGTLIHDERPSPVTDTSMAGVEFHAHTLDGFIQNRSLSEVSFEMMLIFSILSIVGMSIVYFFLPSGSTLFIVFFILYGTIYFGRLFFEMYGIVFDVAIVLFSLVLFTFPITFIYKYFVVDREKHFIQSAFSHYIDPHIVGEISRGGRSIELGGERRDVTVFFSDIAGFTTISEKLGARDLFYLMSSYLSEMTDILIHNRGTLDKYIGDAVMGFFGAPLPLDDHPLRACETALAQRERLPSFNTMLKKSGIDPIDFRVGIARGEVMVGNIGSRERFNYTVLGDTVNLASRLEGVGKEYSTHITVTESVYVAAKEKYFFRRLDRLRVKGKLEPIPIYELIARVGDSTIEYKKYETYEKALELYFASRYDEAAKIFRENTNDPTSLVLADRCQSIIDGSLVVVDGVYDMQTK